ncbi:DUF2325 domain-containing protein [uncultured Ruminococcus sp.]|uniref:DUF2325 domain-containing protein n=1 Tax=uncultured Ruminococcus sp. TaxID=165186 RepID=UPI0025EB27AD|nr:DUF2325 domain-containing protein [uncultured Ruminococcus sp.]
MSVIIVGGNDRMATRYKDICKSYDCKAKVFINKYPTGFDKKIGTPDLAVVFTDTVSHKMLNGLNQRASKLDFPVAIYHSSSCSALKNVLEKYCANKGVANA